jgi:hypothetical protein
MLFEMYMERGRCACDRRVGKAAAVRRRVPTVSRASVQSFRAVIASEAKQSRAKKEVWIASALRASQ